MGHLSGAYNSRLIGHLLAIVLSLALGEKLAAQDELPIVSIGAPFEIDHSVAPAGVSVYTEATGALTLLNAQNESVSANWRMNGQSVRDASDAAVLPAQLWEIFPENEAGLEVETLTLVFSPEPYREPNDSIETAQAVEIGAPFDFRLMPRWDYDFFEVTAPADGAFAFEFLATGGHEHPQVYWLRGDGSAAIPDLARTVRAAAGERVYARVASNSHYWNERGLPDALQARISFTAEPYREPNDSIDTAQAVEIGAPFDFRLMPRWDYDFFEVTAPADGAFAFEFLATGGHEHPQVYWLRGDGSAAIPDLARTVRAAAGERVYARVASNSHYWNERGLPDALQARISFTAEPYREPNDSIDTAQAVEIGAPFDFRLMPRWDYDFFEVTAPADGAFAFEFLATGGHEHPQVYWLRGDGSAAIPDLARTVRAAAGERVYARVASNSHYWNERGLPDALQARISFTAEPYREPNDSIDTAQAVEIGAPFDFRLMPRWDYDFFEVTAPADGAFAFEFLATGGHEHPQVYWLRGDGSAAIPDLARTVRAAAGERVYARVASNSHYWNERGLPDALQARISFTAEPYREPNDSIDTAQAVEIGAPFDFRLMPRWDYDFFEVTAPADGAFAFEFLATGGHEHPQVYWLRGDGSAAIPDLARTVRAAAGERVYARVASNSHYWNERGLPDALQARISFTAEPYREPNDSIDTAQAVEIGAPFDFRLMPRWDYDFFEVTAPALGVLEVEILENGGHEHPYLAWYLGGVEEPVQNASAEMAVEPGDVLYLRAASAGHYWNETGRPDRLAVRIRLRLPDGTYLNENLLQDRVRFLPWQTITIPANSAVPELHLTAPQSGLYRFVIAPFDSAIVTWRAAQDEVIDYGPERYLGKGQSFTISLVRPTDVPATPLSIALSLQASRATAPDGDFPRLPDVLQLSGAAQ